MAYSIRPMMAGAALLALAACSNSQGPTQDQTRFDARKVKDGLATVEAVGASPVLQSFGALGGQIGSGVPAGAPVQDRFVAVVRDIAGIVRPATQVALESRRSQATPPGSTLSTTPTFGPLPGATFLPRSARPRPSAR